MKLTENFTLEELTTTRTGLGNVPDKEATGNLVRLATCILQPLRNAYGRPIAVTSGFRSRAVNEAVGGVVNSQHLRGQAADIKAQPPPPPPYGRGVDGNAIRKENKRLFGLIIDLGLPFDQLIDEQDYSWIHVSYSPRHRRQVLHLK